MILKRWVVAADEGGGWYERRRFITKFAATNYRQWCYQQAFLHGHGEWQYEVLRSKR